MKKFIALAAACLIFSGCLSMSERYARSYSETRLGDNVFRVFSRGSGIFEREQSYDFNMLRCAEITLENGFKYFTVASAQNYSDVTSYTTPPRSESQVIEFRDGSDVRTAVVTRTIPGETYYGTNFGDVNTIECFHEKPEGRGIVFEAAYVAGSIKAKYQIK